MVEREVLEVMDRKTRIQRAERRLGELLLVQMRVRIVGGSRHTATGPKFKFNGSRSETMQTYYLDRRGELGGADGRGHFSQNACNLISVGSSSRGKWSRRNHELQETYFRGEERTN